MGTGKKFRIAVIVAIVMGFLASPALAAEDADLINDSFVYVGEVADGTLEYAGEAADGTSEFAGETFDGAIHIIDNSWMLLTDALDSLFK